MREKRGRLGRTVGAVADSIASAARRGGTRGGEPRVVVYDLAGHATLLDPGSEQHERAVEVAGRMIALWEAPSEGAEPET